MPGGGPTVSLTVFRAEDRWPRHQKGHWNEALDLAREFGWTYEYLDAPHKAGDMVCPAGEHVLKVDKTADGGAFFAGEAKKVIRSRCTHGTRVGDRGKVKERIERAEALLQSAEVLIAGADDDLTHIEAHRDANQRLAELDELALRLDTADLTLAELETLQDEALDDATIDVPVLGEVEATLETAGENVSTASRTLAKVRQHGSLKGLRDHIDTARLDIEVLQARLGEFL